MKLIGTSRVSFYVIETEIISYFSCLSLCLPFKTSPEIYLLQHFAIFIIMYTRRYSWNVTPHAQKFMLMSRLIAGDLLKTSKFVKTFGRIHQISMQKVAIAKKQEIKTRSLRPTERRQRDYRNYCENVGFKKKNILTVRKKKKQLGFTVASFNLALRRFLFALR
jgi:hypothetical protein